MEQPRHAEASPLASSWRYPTKRSRPSQYGARRSFFSTLPLGLRGIDSTKSTEVGHLKRASCVAAVGDELLGASGRCRRPCTTIALGVSPHCSLRHADHGHVGHGRVGHEHVLDLGRVDVLAARHDHVLHPVVDVDVAVVVEVAGVARAEPAVGRDAPWPSPRAGSSSPSCSATVRDPDLADLADRHVLAGRRGRRSCSSTPGIGRPAARSRWALGPSGSWSSAGRQHDRAGGLGQPVGLQEARHRRCGSASASTAVEIGDAP